MRVLHTGIPGVSVVETWLIQDHRGGFARLWCEKELGDLLCDRRIVQINHARTLKAGAIRGLHYQCPPHAEMKFIRCLKGKVWDVAVDLRADSQTFLRWHAEELTPDNMRMLVIPEGCAHGVQVLEPESELLYLHTAAYAPDSEGAVRYDDPALGIPWPLPAVDVSARDRRHPLLERGFAGIPL